jgi:probable F420-dependent oxidoreductase
MARPFRFGLISRAQGDIVEVARRAEDTGYATLLFPDHLGIAAPLVAATAAATVTARLCVGTLVLNNDFRHAAVLAEEVATLCDLSGGRFELGLGAGHMQAEYKAAGLQFDEAPTRIARLAKTARLLRDRFGDALPLLIGGNGTRLLTLAGAVADIVSFTGFLPRAGGAQPTLTHFDEDGLADRIAVVRAAAGERFDELELSLLVQWAVPSVGDVPAVREGRATIEQAQASPFLLLGTVDEMAERLGQLRERFGTSYITVFDGRSPGFGAVVQRLAGT